MTIRPPPLPKGEKVIELIKAFEPYRNKVMSCRPRKSLIELKSTELRMVIQLKKAVSDYERRTGQVFGIGFDVGRVLAKREVVVDEEVIHVQRVYYHRSPPIMEMFRVLRISVAGFGKKRVFIVKGLPDSNELQDVEDLTRAAISAWLTVQDVRGSTGFDYNNVLYIERTMKAEECNRRGIKVFVDDRWEVLQHFPPGTLPLSYSPHKSETEEFSQARGRVVEVEAAGIIPEVLRFLRTS